MRHLGWKFWLGGAWVLFNLSLAGWWLTYGLRQAEILESIQPAHHTELQAQSRMLLSEGIILMLSILLGGLFLLYYIVQEKRGAESIRRFFASFSHELKTSIASFRLQVESFLESAPAGASRKSLDRLSRDSVRLELQLENSLVIAQLDEEGDAAGLFIENVPVEKILLTLSQQWPELALRLDRPAILRGDRRALESAFKNLAQNALLHGAATEVSLAVTSADDRVSIVVTNNGAPFDGDPARLGRLFFRHNARSGNGVGLYLVRRLIERQDGTVRFRVAGDGRLEAHFDLARGSEA